MERVVVGNLDRGVLLVTIDVGILFEHRLEAKGTLWRRITEGL